MRRLRWIMVLITMVVTVGHSQDTIAIGEPRPDLIGITAADQAYGNVLVSDFEDAAYWLATIPRDQGIVEMRRREGPAPLKKRLAEFGDGQLEPNNFVLGLKVVFFRRGHNTIAIEPVRPIPIEGITKTISVWVVGRNFNHVLKVVLLDFWGNRKELIMGSLNFIGWQQLTVAIPPTILQSEFHYRDQPGLRFAGFKIETDPAESFGTYYVYFDQLMAVSDLISLTQRDEDDVSDDW